MSIHIATINDVREAEAVIRQHVSPAPLIRSYALEKDYLRLLTVQRSYAETYREYVAALGVAWQEAFHLYGLWLSDSLPAAESVTDLDVASRRRVTQ
jgi:hypothetical protein